MVFDPKLQGGVAFNQPVSQPNAMESVAGLFNFGMSSLSASGGDAPKPTQDEKFSMAMREFESSKGGAFTWDRKGMREFIFKYPEFTSQAKAWGEGQSIVPKSAEETAIDGVQSWFSTPEGIVAVASANQLPEYERESYLMGEAGRVKQQEAEIAKLDRDVKQLELNGTLDQKRWDALKPTSKAFAINTVNTIVDPILQEVMNGNTVDIDPKLVADLGLNYTSVGINNINAFLQDTRNYLDKSFQSKYVDNFGKEVLPSEDWNKEVLSEIDGMLEVGKQFDTPQEQVAFTEALLKNKALHLLDEQGLGMTIGLINLVPPDVLTRMVGTLAALDPIVAKTVSDSTGKALFSHKVIVGNVADSSKSEAETIAKDTFAVLDKAFVPEMFTAFDESLKKTGNSVVDESTFRSVIGNHADEINRIVTSDAETRTRLSDFINSDIQKTITLVKRNLPAGVNLQFDGKQFILTPEPGTLAEQKWNDTYRPYSQFALNQLPDGMNLDTVNSKIATLGVLGPMGKEVKEAIGILNQTEKPKLKSSTTNSTGSGDIGTKLGIDFASMETEAGLPSGYLNKVAMIESGGNPNASNPSSSAAGLFQQIDSNAAAYGVSDKFDPLQSTEGAVKFAAENKNYLTKVLGREPTGGELYLAHQQGPGGAAKLLSNPSALAVDIVGADAVSLNGGNANMTAGEFANIWISKYNGSRGQMTGSYSASERPTSVAIDSKGREVPESVKGAQGGSTGLSAGTLSFESPEVQEVLTKVQTEPEAAIALAKELLNKPIDPAIKSLIEALVKIGERV